MRARIEQEFTWSGAAAVGADGISAPARIDHLENIGVQVSGTFEADVLIEGRASSSLDFAPLHTFSDAGGIYPVPNDIPLYQLRVTVSGWASGEISALFIGRTAQS